MKNTREAILSILETQDYTLPSALDRCFKEHDFNEKERAYMTNVCHQVFRYKLRFEALIRLYCHKADGLSVHAQNILLQALCEMYSMQSIPLHASINEATQLAKKYAKKEVALINAVLRKTDKEFPNKDLNKEKFMKEIKFLYPKKTLLELQACYESLPSYVLDILRKQKGKEFCEKYLSELNEIPWYSLRFNASKEEWSNAREDVESNALMSKKIATHGLAISNLSKKVKEYHENGILSYQGSSSQILIEKISSHIENKKTKIWDSCAGVGGKSLALLEQDYNIVLASDTSKNKLYVLEEHRKKLGLKEIKTLVADMREVELEEIDCIILDAPCSGIGTLCANPDLRYKITKKSIAETIELQKELIEKAFSTLKKEGLLCYITCSLNSKENEELIQESQEKENAELLFSEYIYPESIGADYLYLAILKKK